MHYPAAGRKSGGAGNGIQWVGIIHSEVTLKSLSRHASHARPTFVDETKTPYIGLKIIISSEVGAVSIVCHTQACFRICLLRSSIMLYCSSIMDKANSSCCLYNFTFLLISHLSVADIASHHT